MPCGEGEERVFANPQNVARTNRAVAVQNRTNRAQSVRECSGDQREEARAAATAPGVNHDKKTPKRGKSAMSLYAKDSHKRAAKSLGFALTLGTESAWHSLTIILMARLTEAERAQLAFATLNSLSENHAYMTASAALFGTKYGEAAR